MTAGSSGIDATPARTAATEPEDAPGSEPGLRSDPDPDPDHDAERRAFFFSFGKQAVSAVGQAAGMADIVGRTSSGLAASLLGLEAQTRSKATPQFTRSGVTPVISQPAAPAADDSFRSAYRLVGDELMLLDQRGIPEKQEEVAAKRGSDVAYYLRVGVVRGGPVMAQVAAYGVALTAAERADQPLAARDVELRRTRRAIIDARPSSRLLGWAMARMESVASQFTETSDGAAMARALRVEADAIAGGFQSAHGVISSALVDALPEVEGRPLAVLVHGDQGATAGGYVGTGLAALRRLRDAGREIRVFVTEARPFMDGARIASWELRQSGIDHKLIADGAVAWLFEREAIDVVLISAEWVAANGDIGALIGSRAIAQQASAASPRDGGRRPLVIASAVSGVIDPATADGTAIPTELRPARDQSAYLANVPIRVGDALVPASDVMSAADLSALVTERGTVAPMNAETVGVFIEAGEGLA